MHANKEPQRSLVLVSVVVATVGLFGITSAMAAPRQVSALVARTSNEVQSLGRLGPLTDLAIQRLLVGDQVAASKFGTNTPIDDPVREQQELTKVRQDAVAM